MSRPRFEVADIIRGAGTDFIERNLSWLRWTHLKVLRAIARCRTAALGGHIDECTGCGHRATISYNSCRNRHCPKCQTGARERWIAARRRELLPTPYVHVVFTLPPQLASLALQNKKVIYGLLLRASAELYWKSRAIPPISVPRSASSACSTPGIRNSNFILRSTVSSPPADSPTIMPAGFDPTHASSFPLLCCGACFAASLSPLSRPLSRTANCTWPENSRRSLIPSSSLPGCVRSSAKIGSCTPNHPSADPSTCCSISAATLTASPSLTIAWSHWRTAKSPFVGATPPITISRK